MHIKKYPKLIEEIETNYKYVMDKKVLPSMRGLQFSGKAIEVNNTRIMNCSALPIDDYRAFSEIMFLLLCGCGVGISVQGTHISQLPPIQRPTKTRRYLVADSIEGWSDSVKALVKAYLCGKTMPNFDFGDIREKGSRLKTSGGIAPGPEPLKDCLHNLQKIFDRKKDGEQLTSLDCHDMACHIAGCVLSGGVRRSSLISLFDHDDYSVLTCKYNHWWETNPQRAMANNSAVLNRDSTNEEEFFSLWEKIHESGSGEPGFLWTNDNSNKYLVNPCAESSLLGHTFCNLSTFAAADISTQEELNNRSRVASFIGTLQAGYTDFHYLRDEWRENTEADSLIGVSMTGIASGGVLKLNLTEAANIVVSENERVSKLIGINHAARTTLNKPDGTSSCVLGCSSGIHASHSPYYIRRIRMNKIEPLYKYVSEKLPDLVEDDFLKPQTQGVLSIPQQSPEGSIFRDEGAMALIERVRKFSQEWIKPGHRSGPNTHSVSATVSIKDDEWDTVGRWMWDNREDYNCLAVLPWSGHSYRQAPFEECSKEEYDDMFKKIQSFDLSEIKEKEDHTSPNGEMACSGGACELTQV